MLDVRFIPHLRKHHGEKLVEELQALGGDLRYLCYLGLILRFGDDYNRRALATQADNRKFRNRVVRDAKRFVDYKPSPLDDPAVSMSESKPGPFFEAFLASPDIQNLPAVWKRTRNSEIQQRITRKTEELRKSASLRRDVLAVFEKYLPPPLSRPKGGRQDLIGSFYLVAVTEHFRKRCKSPHYALALRLLKTARGKLDGVTSDEARSAKERVRRFQEAHRTWRKDLKALHSLVPH